MEKGRSVMTKLTVLIFRKRYLVIGLVILVTLFFGLSLRKLKINPDVLSYFPKKDPAVQLFTALGEEYGGNALAMIVLISEDVFNQATIATVHELTARFQLDPGVSTVTSLTNTVDIKTDEYGFEIGRLINAASLPTEGELAELKPYVLGKEMFRGALVAADASAALIICRLQNSTDQVATCRRLKTIVEEVGPAEKVYYGGLPFLILDLADLIGADLKILIPLVSLVIILFLAFAFQSWEGVFLPLLAVGISLLWTLGLMSLLGIPLSIVSNVIPVVLVAVGSAYSIHVVSKFMEVGAGREQHSRAPADLAGTLSEVGTPVLLSALTTMAGFLSFIFGSYLVMIREFGIFTAVGVLFALLIALTLVPVLLTLRKKQSNRTDRRSVRGRNRERSIAVRFIDLLERLVLMRPKTVAGVGIFLALLGLAGIPQLSRRVDLIEYFQPDAGIRQAEAVLADKFGGSGLIQILVKGDLQDPEVLREMEKLEGFLLAQEDIHQTQSVVSLLKELNKAMGEGRVLPDTREKVINLWFLLEGEEIMGQLVNSDRTEAVIQARMASSLEAKRVYQLVTAIDDYIAGVDAELVIFRQTGMPLIYRNLDRSIIQSQFQSLILAVVLVFLAMLYLLGSLTGALIGLIPIGFTLVVLFGFMGFSRIPLDIATVLVAGVSIGIGIDYSIHFLGRYRQEMAKQPSRQAAVQTTLHTSGQAILINVLTVALGFLVLVFSQLVPLQRFGVLVAVTMLSSGFGALLLLPAILLLAGGRLNLRSQGAEETRRTAGRAGGAFKAEKGGIIKNERRGMNGKTESIARFLPGRTVPPGLARSSPGRERTDGGGNHGAG